MSDNSIVVAPSVRATFSDAEVAALLRVAGALESGEIGPRWRKPWAYLSSRRRLDMSVIGPTDECGSAACIAGWAAVELDEDPFLFIRGKVDGGTSGANALFFPWRVPRTPGQTDDVWCEPKRAARAIRTFVATGEPDWGV